MRIKDGIASLSDLVRSSLRLRPDPILTGEMRGALRLGQDLTMIGRRQGHTQVQATACCAHLKTDPGRSAADAVSGPWHKHWQTGHRA